jgi:MFS family permease
MTAVSLNSILRKGTQIIGPSLGGISVALFGVANTYFIRCGTYVVLLGCLAAISVTNPREERSEKQDPLRAIVDGLRYVRVEAVIGWLLLVECTISIFGSYNTLLVIFARDIFETGPEGLGILQSAAGVGTIAGSFALSLAGNIRHMGRVMMAGAFAFGASILALAYSPWFFLAVPILVLAGAAEITMGALRTTILQLESKRELLGRVMSLQAISTRGFGPLGGFQMGSTAELIGVRGAVALGAVVCMLVSAFVVIRVPAITAYEADPTARPGARGAGRDGGVAPNVGRQTRLP